jgi:hypothetical protein
LQATSGGSQGPRPTGRGQRGADHLDSGAPAPARHARRRTSWVAATFTTLLGIGIVRWALTWLTNRDPWARTTYLKHRGALGGQDDDEVSGPRR